MLNCHKLQGEFSKPITVDTNDSANPHVTLTCKGKIMEAMKVEPTLVNFGRIAMGEKTVERTVKILRGDAGPIKPEVVPSSEAHLEAELREVKAGEEYELVVKAHPDPTSQRVQGKIGLKTGVAEQETVDINVFGTVMPRVSARPPTIVIPSTSDTNWQQAVEFDWPAGTNSFKLLEATVNQPDLEVTVDTQASKPRVLIKLKNAIEGALPPTAQITVKTDDPQAPEVTVPIRYRKVPPRIATPPVVRPRPAPAPSPGAARAPEQPGASPAPTAAPTEPVASPAPVAPPSE